MLFSAAAMFQPLMLISPLFAYRHAADIAATPPLMLMLLPLPTRCHIFR